MDECNTTSAKTSHMMTSIQNRDDARGVRVSESQYKSIEMMYLGVMVRSFGHVSLLETS